MVLTPLPITQQWTLHSLQLINWGCFDAYHRVRFAGPGQVTLITGATGSGKSTLLDAHIVLMHDPATALNRASNASRHRSRSDETRNVVSYMRGVTGQTRDVDGEREVMLREGTAWSAIAETWHSNTGGVFTALSMFFAAVTDTSRPSVRRDAWIDDEFDLQWLEPFANGIHLVAPFPPRAMEKAYEGLQVVSSTSALHRKVWSRLGIGDEGDGKSAMRLLYKVQAADAVESVSDLFTKFVLDEPCTYAAAKEAADHFARLKESHDKVRVIEDQTQRLARISQRWSEYQTGQEEVSFFATLAPSSAPQDTPFWKWRRDRECIALEDAEQAATNNYKRALDEHRIEAAHADQLDTQWQILSAAIASNSALTALSTLESQIDTAEDKVTWVSQNREDLQNAVAFTLTVPSSRAGYDKQRTASTLFVHNYPDAKQAAEDHLYSAKQAVWRYADELRTQREQRQHYEGRRDVTDPERDRIRKRYATLIGIDAYQLPFAGELIDMLPEYERWRLSAEKVLGGTATSLLVPEDSLAEFRQVADAEPTAHRIPYLIVRGISQPVKTADPATIAGRLQYRDHPYAGWLSGRIAQSARHLCVDTPDQLGHLPVGHTEAVTINGQTAHRDGGVVGGQTRHRHTIGFSPEKVLATLDNRIAELEQQLLPAEKAATDAKNVLDRLAAQHDAHSRFLEVGWDRIDVDGTETQLKELLDRKKALAADPTAQLLLNQRDQVRRDLAEANKRVDGLQRRVEDVDAARVALADRKDRAWDHLASLDHLPDPDMGRLDRLLAEYRDNPDVAAPTEDDFSDTAWARFVRHLLKRAQAAGETRDTARDHLAQTFEDYLRTYKNTAGVENLTTDPDKSYWDFQTIYDRHTASGVAGAKAEFISYAAEYGGVELTTLSMAYQTERDEIEARLAEVRAALADQPYGPTPTGRVSIEIRDGHVPKEVSKFRGELHAATSGATEVLSYEEALAKFDTFDRLITQITDPKQRDKLLDVRRHIMLEAQHRDSGRLVAFYRDLGAKSGGETQELTMFIIAAAIRYRVGSMDSQTPRFAPVFMDEGLIKADPERTRRAVSVWTHLGFQPIIATIADKHESVSQTATVILSVSKDSNNRSRIDAAVAQEPVIAGTRA